MIEKQRGVATTDYVCFEDSEYNEKYSCNIRDGKAYAFLFGDNYNQCFFSESGDTHAGILFDEFGMNIYANEKKFEEGIKFIQTHTNGRIFVKKKIITCRPWSLLTKKESQELIKRAKINLDVDISDFIYCISDSDVKDIRKQNVECDLYLIKLQDYINGNFSSLEDIKSKYKQIEKSRLQPADDKYDSFDITGKNGKKLGVGRLGYHMLAYQESKKHNIKKFDEFIKENKKRRLD